MEQVLRMIVHTLRLHVRKECIFGEEVKRDFITIVLTSYYHDFGDLP